MNDINKELAIIAQQIRALSQNGLTYSLSEYDTDRYHELISLSDQLASLATGTEIPVIQQCYEPRKEYVTPKTDIRAVVFNEKNEILLVREKADGLWSLPGGWADVGYTPKEIAVKEVWEETGLKVEAQRLLAVMDHRRHPHPVIPWYVYKYFILCRIIEGSFNEAFDILDKGFFPVDDLPPLSLERVLPEQIRQMYDYYIYPSTEVWCD
ncbi:MAG: NUDIX hydrolase [Tannerellaceae bacterium]|nr:NUDIX hydrolase [Tannerellaceae bacterium]